MDTQGVSDEYSSATPPEYEYGEVTCVHGDAKDAAVTVDTTS